MIEAAATPTVPSAMLDAPLDAPLDGRETIADWAELFGLFSDRTRLRILYHLSRCDEMHVGGLCELLGQCQPAVSHHLSRLREAGVITARREGKLRFYRLLPKRYRAVLETALAQVSDGV
jgi:DNA-binding transcriptional ArsR family regulator